MTSNNVILSETKCSRSISSSLLSGITRQARDDTVVSSLKMTECVILSETKCSRSISSSLIIHAACPSAKRSGGRHIGIFFFFLIYNIYSVNFNLFSGKLLINDFYLLFTEIYLLLLFFLTIMYFEKILCFQGEFKWL